MPKTGGKKAVVLFSGGLDSTTCLAWAISKGYQCKALTVSYGQRHSTELSAARRIARRLGVELISVKMRLPWLQTSSLVGKKLNIPDTPLSKIGRGGIPSTYVPGRNLMFMAMGASWADAWGADAVIAGPNALDYSGYPDCRPEFYNALAKTVVFGTKKGSAGSGIKIITPLIKLSKAEIVKLALKVGAPLELTWSCYRGGKRPCGHCDSCRLRAKGFSESGIKDPAL